jgi:competence protein ComEA
MTPLVWAMADKTANRQQRGLSTLILILLLGWGLNYLLSSQGDLGRVSSTDNIYIQVTGEVRNPGIYGFYREPSLEELISKSGGLKVRLIDCEWGRHSRIAQGTKVEISSVNGYMRTSTGPMPAPYKVTLRVPISINIASEQDLVAIPGIGPTLAKKIIHFRLLYGPFRTPEEIERVPGIGRVRNLGIRPYIEM